MKKAISMKKFILLFFACLCLCNVRAAYLRDVPVTLVQPDGTILNCFASGDEFYNYLHDKDGFTIVQHPETGYYVYAEKRNGELLATAFIAGKYDPASKGLQPYTLISPEEWIARRKAWEVPDERPKQRDVVPNHGTLNNIAIFIRFSDDSEFTNSYAEIDRMFNDVSEGAVSMRSYFRAASYGAMETPTFFYPGHNEDDIISYQDSHPRSYFQPYNETTNPDGYKTYEIQKERESQLLEDAVSYVNTYYPIPPELNIDYDNDGFVDNVCFIVRGSTYGWSELLWPHKSSLSRRIVKINGKRVFVYNFQLADAPNYFNTSTMCHEMNHSFGAPDLYHYNSTYGSINPVGSWDLMEINTTPPQHCGAYMKMKYGHWIDDIPEISQTGTYTLNPISSATPTNVAYKIATEDPNQFYVIEYRDKNSLFETSIPGSGILIYRIDTRFYGNANYDPNNDIYDEVYIFRPNGTTTDNGSLSTAHFSSNTSRTDFSSNTNPRPFLSNGNYDNSLIITNITSVGSTISFTIGNNSSCEPPSNLSAVVNERNVQLSWEAAENAESYNIYRNGVFLVNTDLTTHIDDHLSYGTYSYYVKSVDNNGIASSSTESVTVSVEPIATNLRFELSGNCTNLSWTAPEWVTPDSPTTVLTYGSSSPCWYWPPIYYAHRYLAEDLAQFAGMVVYKASTYIEYPGTYTVYVYTSTKDDEPDPNSLVMSQERTISVSQKWIDFMAEEPIALSGDNDLWVVFKQENTGNNYPIATSELGEHNTNAFYASLTSPTSLVDAQPNYNSAWMINASLTDGAYTYNLYQDGTKIAQGLGATTYNATLNNNAANLFTVKTNYYGGESAASNMAGITMGSASLSSLELDDEDAMTITSGSTLTVTGSLTNTDPDNLVIEDGAQLIHHSDGVKATVKRSITTYTSDSDGWYTIAAPFTEFSPTQVATGSYDLYAYDEDGEKEWINYKAHLTDFPITQTNGYLYAHSPSTTINMTGTLNNGDFTETVNLSYGNSQESIKGYNLLGNPTTHDITFTTSANVSNGYYYLENGDQWVYSASNTVPSGRGFLVKAEAPEQSVTLNQTSREKTTDSFLCIKIDNQKTYVKMGEGVSMPLLDFKGKRSNTYLIRNGQPYIMLVKDDQNEIPVCFKAPKDGEYTLTISTTPNSQLPTPNYLHLVDNLTGADIDLLQTPNYSFNALADDYESRFKLVFSESEVNDPGEDEFDITDDSLEILDVTGRVVATDLNTKLTPGVYILKNANNNKTKKIIIN